MLSHRAYRPGSRSEMQLPYLFSSRTPLTSTWDLHENAGPRCLEPAGVGHAPSGRQAGRIPPARLKPGYPALVTILPGICPAEARPIALRPAIPVTAFAAAIPIGVAIIQAEAVEWLVSETAVPEMARRHRAMSHHTTMPRYAMSYHRPMAHSHGGSHCHGTVAHASSAAAMSHRDYLAAFQRLLAIWAGRKSGRKGNLTGCQKPGGCQGNGENILHVKPTFLTSRPPSRMSAELNPPGRLKVR